MRKGIAITTIGNILLTLVALAMLLIVLTKLSPVLSKYASTFIDNIRNTICDKFGLIRSILCKAVI